MNFLKKKIVELKAIERTLMTEEELDQIGTEAAAESKSEELIEDEMSKFFPNLVLRMGGGKLIEKAQYRDGDRETEVKVEALRK